ncbi:RagB/SusD family nutrient uptake outer membrane protein [Zunongwangia pacifica]|uniref:RagB/SusD family nutrient uptake outer membrane protein n=1 Tax=Zunongwangia pacifica TaxID=2911062 RepID=A0A9X1ZS40_9FLAO|nr:RagB/SusD family nutrient uptake outer membrane protein [Zunongwangia pacifica]MCL6218200.1 RagB/SusD family nutrient uptake outer membrane protein [Zunongwangia pacifica]
MILDINKNNFRLWSIVLALGGILTFSSCEDSFLDVVPDNINTIDKVFNLRNEAEKYLFTCYSYMPSNGSLTGNPAFLAGDEMWIPDEFQAVTVYSLNIALGLQQVGDPFFNAWDGRSQANAIFQGIRHCNILIENLKDPDQVPDMSASERERWIAEGKFLKAYYHFYLMRMYGAVPILDKSIDVDADVSEFYVPRSPFDEGIDYIVQLLDEAAAVLPPSIADQNTEYGRITSVIAKSLKARVLLTAASPLFNGNEDLVSVANTDGTLLYNTSYEASKWQEVVDAASEAITLAESSGHALYKFSGNTFNLTDTTSFKLSIRNAVTLRRSEEVIWPNTQSIVSDLQRQCMAPLSIDDNHRAAEKIVSPTLDMAKLFYSKNGVPIHEDKTLDFSDILEIREANGTEKNNILQGYRTSRLNFDREHRFYADLGFDGAIWYRNADQDVEDESHIEAKYADYAGSNHAFFFNVTGYFCKKLVNNDQSFGENGASYRNYAWPEMRLADLYLIYAEALNEVNGPTSEVFEYLDAIRERAGLEGVKDSWINFSNNPNKPESKSGLRDIIHQERLIELAFEGQRYWDMLRWKSAVRELNKPIQGWNVYGEEEADYYQIRTLHQQRFVSPRDYFWPIWEYALLQNPNLVQNPGWN